MESNSSQSAAAIEAQRAPQITGALFVLAAGLLWGTSGTSQALAPTGATPGSIGAIRLLIGGVTLLLLAVCRGGFTFSGWPIVNSLVAGGCVALYQLCFFGALSKTGVAVGTLVAIGSSPIIAGILGLVFRGERPGKSWGLATVLALFGCGLLVAGGGEIAVDPIGIALALGAGFAYASYTLAIKSLLPGRTPDAVMAMVFCIGAILLSPLLLTSNLQWVYAPKGLAVALYLGVVVTALSYWLFVRGLKSVPVATAVTLSLAEPLTAALLGILFLGERLTVTALCGIPVLFSGLAVLAISMAGQAKGR